MKKVIAIILSTMIMLSTTTALASDYKYGIDVSHHNDSVDYVRQAEDGKEFVMIRLGYYNHLDDKFWDNVKAVSDAGLNFGVYLYSYAYSMDEAEIEADFVLDTLAQMPEKYDKYFTLPVAYDVEDANLEKFGKAQITAQTVYFCEQMNLAGYTPMVYANLNWFNNYLDLNKLVANNYKLWYANYTNSPDFTKQKQIGTTGVYADIWQYQAGENHESKIDQNIAYDLDSLMHKYVLVNQVDPTCSNYGKRIFQCSICNERKTVRLAKTAHSKKTAVTPATVSKNGKVITTCKNCSAVLSTKTVYAASSISLSATKCTYDGKVKTPSVVIKDSKGNTLKKNTDYTLTYSSGRKTVGKYSVKITFKGNYSGTATKYFTVVPKGVSLSKLTASRGGLKAYWGKNTAQTTGYQVQIATNSGFTSGVKTYTVSKNTTTSKAISSLSRNKRYYVRVRTYKTAGSTKYYSAWSKSKNIKTN